MKPLECEFESEVLAAALQSRWPERVDAELRAHVAGCTACADVLAIAGSIEESRAETWAQAAIPDSGKVWRLCHSRARFEAARAAGRPITVAQVAAFACSAGLLGACFGATSSWFQKALTGAAGSLAELKFQPTATALITQHGVIAAAVGAVVLLIPAAILVAVLRD
jgi:hypothetical protein